MSIRLPASFWQILLLTVLLPLGNAQAQSNDTAPAGETEYTHYCQKCHGLLEQSNKPFFPSLIERAGNMEPPEFITAVMEGRFGRASDLGSHSMPSMPALDYLANEDIAAIASYIYARAGIPNAKISIDRIALIRAETAPDTAPVVLTKKQYEAAEAHYFSLCAGCHGIDRLGLSGSALDDLSLKDQSPRTLMETIHYGSPWGMPNWGTSEKLSLEDISALARYLKLPRRRIPTFTLADVTASWQLLVDPQQRPRQREFSIAPENLFVSLLHDSGQVALIDASSRSIAKLLSTDLAPHMIDVSADGRYLYVVARSGHIALIDLYMKDPQVVARVRVGFESRNIAVSKNHSNAIVVAGAYSQPHLVTMAAETLRPLSMAQLDDDLIWSNRSAVLQIEPIAQKRRFLVTVKGQPGLFELQARNNKRSAASALKHYGDNIRTARGSFDLSGRYFLSAADPAQIVVFDTQRRETVASISVPGLQGGGEGVAYVDAQRGAVWAMASTGSGSIFVVSTASGANSKPVWQVARTFKLPGGGTLHSTGHPDSDHLWVDLTLNASGALSGDGVAVDRQHNIGQTKKATLRDSIATPDRHFMRAIHPQFNADGSEVWFTLWNRQDLPSAIVVVDDKTLQVKSTITDPRLITPIRTYSVASMLSRQTSNRSK